MLKVTEAKNVVTFFLSKYLEASHATCSYLIICSFSTSRIQFYALLIYHYVKRKTGINSSMFKKRLMLNSIVVIFGQRVKFNWTQFYSKLRVKAKPQQQTQLQSCYSRTALNTKRFPVSASCDRLLCTPNKRCHRAQATGSLVNTTLHMYTGVMNYLPLKEPLLHISLHKVSFNVMQASSSEVCGCVCYMILHQS